MQPKTTPMVQQYMSIKSQYPDAILFYRMGDFYEMFFEDAEKASRLLEITLTSRNKNDEASIPMCGVPYRAVQGYIARLIEKGVKVAVCDQVEDPALAKGLVRREVVRVITPGMIVENEFLDARSNNYVLAAARNGNQIGIAYLDISTGTFRITESEDRDAVVNEIPRIAPREVLLPESFSVDPFLSPLVKAVSEYAVTFFEDKYFEYRDGRIRLTGQFQTLSLEGFGCEEMRAGVGAAGALLHYVEETQKRKAAHFAGIETYLLDDYLWVDDQSCRNLEVMANLRTGKRQGTLLEVLDQTLTAMGGRLFRQWLRYPLLNPGEINHRLDAVAEARDRAALARKLREDLKSVHDMERLGARVVMGHANARDLLALKRSLNMLPEILDLASGFNSPLFQWDQNLDNLKQLAGLIEKAIREDAPPTVNEGGLIKSGYHVELDELISISKDGKTWLARLEAQEKAATGINSLKVRYNKVFGYYLEVPRVHADKMPAHYVRKQTLVNAERYITDELKTFETKVLNAEQERADLEYRLFNDIREQVRACNPQIQEAAKFTARMDCLLGLSYAAEQNDYCRPEINTSGELAIEDGRHPVIEKMITAERFVPNSIRMDNQRNQILMITGPNMAGKSTVLRQAALVTIMAQMGSFVPAKTASVCVTDRIFTRVGALDNLSQGQSTFMVEMQETANILNNATPDSLVILDEIGRGTSTFDGLSIAWAVAEYLHDLKKKGVKTLFATHYHELTDLDQTKPRVRNFNIAVKEFNDQIIFLRKLVEGGTNRSYGIQVARLAGIPEGVIRRARSVLDDIEAGNHLIHNANKVFEKNARFVPRQAQLGLFRDPDSTLAESLREIDLTQMTPLDALNYLNGLQEKIKFH